MRWRTALAVADWLAHVDSRTPVPRRAAAVGLPVTRDEAIRELREWIVATLEELGRSLEALRDGADPAAVTPRIARLLGWSPVIDELIRLIEEPRADDLAVAPVSGRVLVVDDSKGYRLLVKRVLSVAGFEVEEAEDGARAWERLQREAFDVLVSDVEMPELDGFALVRCVRTSPELRELPVIMLSGLEAPPDLRDVIAGEVEAVLYKYRPDTFSTLLAHLAELTGVSRTAGELRPPRRPD